MTMQKNILTTLLLLVIGVGGVMAQENLIANGDFSSGSINDGTTTSTITTVTGWNITPTIGSDANTGNPSIGLSSNGGNDRTQCINGGSQWNDKVTSKQWSYAIIQEVTLEADTYYAYSYQILRNRSGVSCTVTLSDGNNNFSLDTPSGIGWATINSYVKVPTGGSYTLTFTFSAEAGTDKQHYFRLDNVSLQAVEPVQFSEGDNEHWYYINFAESGIIVAGQGTNADDQKQLITAYPTGNNDHHLWKFEGTYDNFKMKNKGNNQYARIASNKFQTIKDDKAANDFAIKAGTSSRGGWVITQSGEGNVTGMNASGGNFGGRDLVLWQDETKGLATTNNALTFIPESNGFHSLASSSDIDNGVLKDVSVTRTFAEGWGTLCLPFDVQVGQLKANFGNNVELYEYTEESNGALTFTRVNLSKYDNSGNERDGKRDNGKILDAGKPYLIKASTTVTNPVFTQRVLSTTKNDVTYSSVAFKGNYESTLSSAGLYGVTTAGYILSGQSDVYFTPWMAYFEAIEAGVKLSLMIDGETTVIGELKSDGSIIEKGNRAIFDLSGRRVAKPQRGLYIVNGKKVIIK